MRRTLWRRFDWVLFILALSLSVFGVVMIASALSGNEVLAQWPWRQAAFLGLGIVLLLLAAAFDYRLLGSVAYLIYGGLLAALLIIYAFGTVSGGAQRWLAVGDYLLQPSELAKLGVIVVLAHFLATREARGRLGSILTPVVAVIMLAPAVALIYLQPNLSTALSLLAIGGMMLLMAGMPLRHMVLMGLAVAVAAVPVWRMLLQDYMKDRILAFLNPATVSAAERYNIEQAMISIGSGGWLGRGLFRGSQNQLHFLRVRHTDFIFSVTAEELGFIGAVVLIVLFGLLLWRLTYVASLSRDTFGRLIVVGITTMILFQFLVNIGMNLNLLPATGVPLPFVSYGGSSLWTMLIGIGLAESVAMRHRRFGFD
jgi:rod shape determining protein RodA